MDIQDQKDLDKLIQLCRKRGVATITVGDITVTLSPVFQEQSSPYKRRKAAAASATQEDTADPFQAALKQAKSHAKRAQDGLTAALEQSKVAQTNPAMQPKDYPSDLEMLLWSSTGGE
jgi:hypothetical protein